MKAIIVAFVLLAIGSAFHGIEVVRQGTDVMSVGDLPLGAKLFYAIFALYVLYFPLRMVISRLKSP